MNKRISIIGGGISGITTGLTLQLLGFDTTIYAEYLVDDETPDDSRFASLYPAASVIPHSVQSGKLGELFPISQDVFRQLYGLEVPGMFKHRHYELFENKRVPDPFYAHQLENYSRIKTDDRESVPHRPETGSLSGWVFDCFFTEWPAYIQELYKLYQNNGGRIVRKRITPDDLQELETDVIVNCSGIWSADLFEDTEPRRVSRGHLIQIQDAPLIHEASGAIPSYNYTAGSNVYSDTEGNATDVYFYPRTNGWIIGGSRQQGVVDDDGYWTGTENEDTITVDGLPVPRPIYTLNREIIRETYDIDLEQFSNLTARIGYRYVRTEEGQGLRLERAVEYGKTVIHNYGHGGAGVTLSWGCALYVAELLEQEANGIVQLQGGARDELRHRLKKLVNE